ncbi:ESX secretion-associated protein EspG [Actinocrispum wychmicini]|uniref:ESAT-6 protein secretion system EspG family protein n=1 Tax=Actinocrispum wychmicini TaxID=1213861 RepID=A0A4R2K5E0_9PSEU|nr:ESX secretion-associated protein EspG [Actinocrispum wychmicini]TCO65008.1 ESAT-6 protein secretion system EspG family protein [Actinocrispum wychmicini]
MQPRPVTISALEFDVLWEHLGLEDMPLAVKVPSPGATHTERKQLVQQAWAELEQRGLGRSVDIHPGISTGLHVLARPDREVDGRTWLGRSVRFLAASRGEDAVLAILADNYLTMHSIAPTALPSVSIGVLAQVPAGPGQSVSLLSADFETAANQGGGTRRGFEDALRGRGVREDDVVTLAAMINDVQATGNFGAAARDKWGKRHRADRVVAFFDTEEGRYVQLRRASQDGSVWTTIAPTDNRRLVHHVEQLLNEIVQNSESR